MKIVIEIILKPNVKYLLNTDGAILLLEKNDSNHVLMNIEVPNISIKEISKDFIAYLLIDSVYNLRDIERFEIINPKIY